MKKIVVYCSAALMLLILSFADFMGLAPLGIGLVIALSALGLNAPILSLFLVLGTLIDFSPINLIYSAGAGLVLSIIWLFSLKYKIKSYVYIIGAILSQAGLVIAGIITNYSIIAIIVGAFLSFIFAYLSFSIGVPVVKNFMRFKLLDSELISGGIVLAALAYGLAKVPISVPVAAFFFAVAVLVSASVTGGGSLAVGLCFALGYAAANGVSLVGAFALMSLTALIFIPAPKILSALSLIMSFIMYTFFFNVVPGNALMWLASLLLGGIVYLLIPNGSLKRAKEFFSPDGRKALRGMVNRNRVVVGRKLQAVSGVFGEMSVIMGGAQCKIGAGHMEELNRALIDEVCAKCGKFEECKKTGLIGCVSRVMARAIEGGVSIADLPDEIKNDCISIAPLISTSDELASLYVKRMSELRSVTAAKSMVSEQLKGVSDILGALAEREAEPLRFDADAEKKIVEELTYRNVIASEALVTGNGTSVMITAMTDTIDRETIKSVLKKLLGLSYVIDNVEGSNLSGYAVVYASARPKFDVVFSMCGCPKRAGELSGDTHSFIKIDSHRFMMAVCDGMGSGARANGFSQSTISLIENFYRAGFSHSLVLSSVNRFLTLSSEEIYSAVDIAVVDLNSGVCDVIKIGSPASYIKTKDSVLRVDGSALPIGVLEEMKPSIATYTLRGGETVVLTSDGAADSFKGDSMADVINNTTKLPEPLCKTVVDAALNKTGNPIDDITVAAFHIFEAA